MSGLIIDSWKVSLQGGSYYAYLCSLNWNLVLHSHKFNILYEIGSFMRAHKKDVVSRVCISTTIDADAWNEEILWSNYNYRIEEELNVTS